MNFGLQSSINGAVWCLKLFLFLYLQSNTEFLVISLVFYDEYVGKISLTYLSLYNNI